MQSIKGVVRVFHAFESVCDVVVYFEGSVEDALHELGYVGARLPAAERRANPPVHPDMCRNI